MTHPIDPQTSILVESYYSFGIERRLRRYERIRDVMNSWDRDSQFTLQIVLDEPLERSKDLAIENVPRSAEGPKGFVNFPIQHSQKPGRWNKRLLTLLDNGQLYSHKKTDAKLTDKDSLALCMLSDFDLYQITDEDMLRSLRPPKKHSFAIKSQQKSSVFLNTENFIHFFNMDDADAAYNLQHCVHRWRSWYLVNKKVDLGKKEKALHIHGADHDDAPKATDIARIGRHRLKVSVDETPYTIGTFQPLMDMDRFDKPIEDFGKDFLPPSTTAPAVTTTSTKKTDLPSRPRGNTNAAATVRSASNPVKSPTSPTLPAQRIDVFARDDEFKATGLLGKAYEGLKQQVETRTSDEQPTENPFTGGLLKTHDQEVALKQQQHRLEQQQRQQEQVRQLNRSNTTVGKTGGITRSNTTVGTKHSVPLVPLLPRSNTGLSAGSSSSTPVSRTHTPVAIANGIAPLPRSHTMAIPTTNSTPVSRSNTVATRQAPTSETEPSSRQRSRSRSRTRPTTATASGGTRPSTSDGASYGRQRDKPAPLLDMAPAMPEIPSAWRNQMGRGIRAPTGAPLISMATDSHPNYRPPGMVTSPPMSPLSPTTGLTRRSTTKVSSGQRGASAGVPVAATTHHHVPGAAPTVRKRSQSTAATTERRRLASQESRPPVPLISSAGTGSRHHTPAPVPSSRRRDNDEDVPLINFVDRTRGREMGTRGLETRSRTGALRHL